MLLLKLEAVEIHVMVVYPMTGEEEEEEDDAEIQELVENLERLVGKSWPVKNLWSKSGDLGII